MEHKRTKLKAPEGFRNLLECLTCEILRVQPSDIPKFAADYLKGRLISRQEKGYDECLLGSQIDGFYRFEPSVIDSCTTPSNKQEPTQETTNVPSNAQTDTPSNHQPYRVINYDNKDLAASKIQAGFHGYKCRQQIKEQHEAAGKIQAGYRGYSCRKDLKQKHEAATKIQAEFRGFQVRKDNSLGKGVSKDEVREAENSKSLPCFESKDDAATAIQSGYRGYRDRKEIAKQSEAATTIQADYRGYQVRKLRRSKSEAAIKIQSSYRGYRVRQIRRNESEAALKIQKHYRGYRVRKDRSNQSEAATKIQANFRGYRVRKNLKEKDFKPPIPKKDDLLEVVQHYDSRSSFSLPAEDVKFDVNLDSDSDIDIDKVVDQMEAKNKKDDDKSTVDDDKQS